MESYEQTQKVAWSLSEISEATGLSLGFLRKEVRRGILPVKKFGRRVLVLAGDLKLYLEQGSKGEAATHTKALMLQ